MFRLAERGKKMSSVQYYRPTKININLKAIQQNIRNLQQHLTDNVEIIAVVKANAYGHGDVEVARTALQEGATTLAVATFEEALHMRKHFKSAPILVMGIVLPQFVNDAITNDITLTAPSLQWLEQVMMHRSSGDIRVHLKIDSGMGRIGIRDEEEMKAVAAFIQCEGIEVDGIFTHFATADEQDEAYFLQQAKAFNTMVAFLPNKPRLIHAANTATALIKSQAYQFNAVRYGIAMYGLAASPYVEACAPFALEPALSLHSALTHVKQIEAGDHIGYGATFIAKKRMFIGTLPIGYADGLLRGLAGQEVLIDGQRMPIVGKICMDQCMVAMNKNYPIGEPVTLIGTQQNTTINIDEWAERLNTINYEIPCTLSYRVPRIHKND